MLTDLSGMDADQHVILHKKRVKIRQKKFELKKIRQWDA
jgi:hypothetical protein